MVLKRCFYDSIAVYTYEELLCAKHLWEYDFSGIMKTSQGKEQQENRIEK